MEEAVIQKAIQYIKEYFADDYSGHDYWHSFRVYKLAEEIAKKEQANLFVVRLAALLHDVDDRKISPDTYEEKGNAVSFMKQCGIDDRIISDVCTIIEEVSFEGNPVTPQSLEGKCVQDADRLDAIGAIGIARAFSYGGNHNRVIYDPDSKPSLNMTGDEYRNHISTTINHFYEKLFLLKELLNTSTAKEIAEHRDRFMHEYVDEFLLEWEGKR
ncbi:MAG: HD domain-containing protein [Sellimonas sp.]|uniref:HD domain-containing protein n=1 Tax=Sellimonas sp. TaxID=2021466 RepID=UPI0039A17337